jgi:hypothetical protein
MTDTRSMRAPQDGSCTGLCGAINLQPTRSPRGQAEYHPSKASPIRDPLRAPSPVSALGAITSRAVLGGLHHQYCRIYTHNTQGIVART